MCVLISTMIYDNIKVWNKQECWKYHICIYVCLINSVTLFTITKTLNHKYCTSHLYYIVTTLHVNILYLSYWIG